MLAAPGARKKPAGPRFGSHLSVAGGLHNAFTEAVRVGCDSLQVFVKNQRQWAAAPLRDEAVAEWRRAASACQVTPVVAHASYLINLASPDDALWEKSIAAYADELRRCGQLGIRGLIVHPGAHLGSGEAAGCRRIAAAVERVLDACAGAGADPWLEITAGQGSSLGRRFEELRDVLAALRRPQCVGVCFDTCHALAAGYRFDTDETYAVTFAAFDRCIGLAKLCCFHLNDSQRELGSRVDRHTHIGKGHVGRGAFQRIVNDPRFAEVPMILETPKGTDPRGRDYDRINLGLLRRMVGRPAADGNPRRRAAVRSAT